MTWEIPSSVPGQGMAPLPHTTGPNPAALPGSIGAQHHLTTSRAVPPAQQQYPQTEGDAGGNATAVAFPSPWHIVERVHQPVLPGGGLGAAVHDQYMAINMIPNAAGQHEVRSATVNAAAFGPGGVPIPGSVTIRTASAQSPVSPRTARR